MGKEKPTDYKLGKKWKPDPEQSAALSQFNWVVFSTNGAPRACAIAEDGVELPYDTAEKIVASLNKAQKDSKQNGTNIRIPTFDDYGWLTEALAAKEKKLRPKFEQLENKRFWGHVSARQALSTQENYPSFSTSDDDIAYIDPKADETASLVLILDLPS